MSKARRATYTRVALGLSLVLASVGFSAGSVVRKGEITGMAPAPRGVDRAAGPLSADAQVMVGAGDIAGCGSQKDEETAALLDNVPGTVFTLGDNVYPDGTAAEFRDCYDPTWGRHKARTRPAAGNHDYHTSGASAYFNYFGAAAGNPGEGYYSYDVGEWHVIVLNSQCSDAGGCDPESPQGQWLQADLAVNRATCTLAYWHKPRFSSDSVHGNSSSVLDFWSLLYEAGADVVLNGHAHSYERFAPQDPQGAADPDHGIREFVVGTGGADLYGVGSIQPNSEVRNNDTHGVLKLSLYSGGYDWEFIPISGKIFTDSGRGACVSAADVPHAPVAVADVYLTDEGEELSISAPGVLGNDGDLNGDALTADLVSGVSQGTLTLNPDGSFLYRPQAGFKGTDQFTYKASDGALDSSPVSVTIRVGIASRIYLPWVTNTYFLWR